MLGHTAVFLIPIFPGGDRRVEIMKGNCGGRISGNAVVDYTMAIRIGSTLIRDNVRNLVITCDE